jgi:hypothetical protein
MTAAPGADERRARLNLLRALDGARPVPPPPRTRDWLDDIIDDREPPAPARPVAPRLPDWRKRETADLIPPAESLPEPVAVAGTVGEQPEEAASDVEGEPVKPRPRRDPHRYLPIPTDRVHHAYAGLPARARAVLYTGGAAGLGWAFGLPQTMHSWIADCGHDQGPTAGLVLGAGLILACAVLVDRRTRGWWPPLAWVCRIPLASALLALALYAPGAAS